MLEIIQHINPTSCSYEEWLTVGMAISHEGGSSADWEAWSMGDTRYKVGECARKWNSFRASINPVTAGSLIHIAKSQGWIPKYYDENEKLDFNMVIDSDDDDEYVFVNKDWLETSQLEPPKNWNSANDLKKYLSTLFQSDEHVGYVSEAWEKEGDLLPKKGVCTRTAGELINLLGKCKGDIAKVVGDHNEDAGAWIRFNPLDGKGVMDNNVTSYRYALVESDVVELDKQLAIIKELELPCAAVVHSGNKSIHAIVRIDADTFDEYRKRVDFLYKICDKNGLEMDRQNRNPSRLSRMPGITRKGKKQYLIDTNIGKKNWEEWEEYIEELNDDLPDFINLATALKNMPDLDPVLIDGLLRLGHKMLMSGPSKAGKSIDMIELAVSIADGLMWHFFQCVKGPVLYCNLEISGPSCLWRASDIGDCVGLKNPQNIDFWNLRGKDVEMKSLAKKLIRRAKEKGYVAIFVDPLYKVITGDENSAEQMGKFFKIFDHICAELNCSMIYCHHHSKGEQGGKKSMDRASGSGVFGRDPDAVLDYIELNIDKDRRKQILNARECGAFAQYFEKNIPSWSTDIPLDDQLVSQKMFDYGQSQGLSHIQPIRKIRIEMIEKVSYISAWRMSGNVREFPPFKEKKFYFEYPIHTPDKDGFLIDAKASGEEAPWESKRKKQAESKKDRVKDQQEEIEDTYDMIHKEGKQVTVASIAELLGVSDTTARKRIKANNKFNNVDGKINKKGTE